MTLKRSPVRKLSPSQRHLARWREKQALTSAPAGRAIARPDTGPAASAYDLLRAQLGEHMAELKGIQERSRKIARKREMLETYEAHIETVLKTARAEGKALQDEIFVRIMIWVFDCAEADRNLYPMAFVMAEHVLTYGLELPENFRRSPAALILESVVEPALKALAVAPPDVAEPFPTSLLLEFEELTKDCDILDVIRAKLNKALGLLYIRRAKAIEAGATDGPAGALPAARQEALNRLRTALSLDENIGVKKDIEALDRALKKSDA